MAKRKRLLPPSTGYLDTPGTPPAPQPFAPIAGVAGAAAATAAASELAETLRNAREAGRLIIELPLETVDTAYLVRDRIGVNSDEMSALIASIDARGQQTPIEVVDNGVQAQPRYGLISGWRRVEALRRIAERDKREINVLALLRSPDESSDAYLAMIEENEIRVGLSYYERARIALKAVEQGAFPTTKAALLSLFHAASRAKRSKIRSFLTVVEALEGIIVFPEEIGERTGLRLAKALDEDPSLKGRLRTALDRASASDGVAEQKVIIETLSNDTARTPPRSVETQAGEEFPIKSRLRKGLYFTQYENGDVLLSGPKITRDLRVELIDWLYRHKSE